MKLYKYKSLPHKKELTAEEKEQLEYCKDILLNHRLFMAPRETLNDPFEGMAIPISLQYSNCSFSSAVNSFLWGNDLYLYNFIVVFYPLIMFK